MKIESLRLRGFTGISKGLGLEEITIDFSNIAGLTAMEGVNGAGKSTVLENLHGYPMLASRDGALFQHVLTRNAEKELSFSYGDHSYRTLVKVDAQSERSEGFIWKDGHPECRGKISEYSRYIKNLLGSPELFFASVFSAQNAKKLSEMRTGELKELFSEFLRLDRLVAWENTAKQAGNLITAKVSQIDIRRAGLTDRLKGIEDLKTKAVDKAAGIADLEEKKAHYVQEIHAARTRIDALKETVAKNALAVSRKADVQATIDRLTSDLAREKQAAEAELETIRAKYRNLTAELAKCEAVLKDKDKILGAAEREQNVISSIEGITRELERLTEEAAKLQEVTHALDKQLQQLRQAVKDLDNDETLKKIDANLTDLRVNIEAQDRKIKDLKEHRGVYDLETRIAVVREKMAALDLKDPACTSSTCSFIVDALKASELLPGLQKELDELRIDVSIRISGAEGLRDEYQETAKIVGQERTKRLLFIDAEKLRLKAEIGVKENDLKTSTFKAKVKNETLDDRRKVLARLRLEFSMLKDLAAKKPDIQVAEARKADLTAQQSEVTENGKTIKAAWEEKELGFSADIDCARGELADVEKTIDLNAEQILIRERDWLRGIENKELPSIDYLLLEAREEAAKIQGELSRMSEAQKELEAVVANKSWLQKEISEWMYLKSKCSKDGLQALEIDGAAPEITEQANKLLSLAFGPLYSVKLVTQDADGKECLDIVVISEEGEEVLLDNLSGGQKIWCLMALRLGMTLLSKDKSGRDFRTAFFDESDGPLDPENALNYVNMYRAFMKTGGFNSLMFVSHKPSCRSLADNILVFQHGKNPYWK